jgi:hypothetical protein
LTEACEAAADRTIMAHVIRPLDRLVTAIRLWLLVRVARGAEVVPVREVTTDAAAGRGVRVGPPRREGL